MKKKSASNNRSKIALLIGIPLLLIGVLSAQSNWSDIKNFAATYFYSSLSTRTQNVISGGPSLMNYNLENGRQGPMKPVICATPNPNYITKTTQLSSDVPVYTVKATTEISQPSKIRSYFESVFTNSGSNRIGVVDVATNPNISSTFHPNLTKLIRTGGFCVAYSGLLSRWLTFKEPELVLPDGTKIPWTTPDSKVNIDALEAMAVLGGPLIQNTQGTPHSINMHTSVGPGQKKRKCGYYEVKDSRDAVKKSCEDMAKQLADGADCQLDPMVDKTSGHSATIKSVKYVEGKGCVYEVYDTASQTAPISAPPKTHTVTVKAGTSDSKLDVDYPEMNDKFNQVGHMCCKDFEE